MLLICQDVMLLCVVLKLNPENKVFACLSQIQYKPLTPLHCEIVTETQKMYIFMYICGSKAICMNYQKLIIFIFTQAFLK